MYYRRQAQPVESESFSDVTDIEFSRDDKGLFLKHCLPGDLDDPRTVTRFDPEVRLYGLGYFNAKFPSAWQGSGADRMPTGDQEVRVPKYKVVVGNGDNGDVVAIFQFKENPSTHLVQADESYVNIDFDRNIVALVVALMREGRRRSEHAELYYADNE